MGLWVLGLSVSNINESQLQTYESKTLFLMKSLQYYCIPGLAEIKTYVQKMQDAQVTKSLKLKNRLLLMDGPSIYLIKIQRNCLLLFSV